MRDDRDNYDENEDSEYHFSEDDVSYDVETKTPKATATGGAGALLTSMTRSKRMLISIVVFLALIFIVYKMVAPSAVVPSTDIAPVAKVTPKPVEVKPVSQQQIVEVPAQPVQVQQVPVQQVPVEQAQVAPAPAQATAPVTVPMNQPVMAVAPPVPVQQAQGAPVIPPASVIDQGIAAMTATENNLTAQMQTTSAQKLNEYEAQNKALREQLDTLNARMSTMETQLNQLVQSLIKQNQTAAPAAAVSPVETAQPAAPKLAYSVQAIIPGRAWLRSDSGETVTVAEGDVIKDAGRVTKIDPYDGVVEINVAGRTVSLSYGNGA